MGNSGGGWGRRSYENLLFIIVLFQLDELALCVQFTLARITKAPSERGNEMKKIFMVVMAVAFAFSVAGFAVAADNTAKPVVGGQEPAAVQKGEQAAPAAAPKVEEEPAATPGTPPPGGPATGKPAGTPPKPAGN